MEKIIYTFFTLSPLLLIVASFVLTYLAIPRIVKFAKKNKLYDVPDARKEHTTPIPALGGISIMAGMVPALLYLGYSHPNWETFFFVMGMIVLFVTGVVDDIILLSATKRLLIQLLIATCVVLSGVKFPHLFGIFGIYEISPFLLILLNVIIVTGIINAFNLIDGINGLAGGLGCISVFILGIFLIINREIGYAVIAFSAAISYLAFLRYNLKPTFIFMGDNGSLVLGYLISFFSLKLLQNTPLYTPSESNYILKVVLTISCIPVLDALRVFAGRMLKKRSPFSADKTHIHHFFIKKGFSHHKSSMILYMVHVALILLALINSSIKVEYTILINVVVITAITLWLGVGTTLTKSAKVEAVVLKTENK